MKIPRKNLLEWAVFGVSMALLVALAIDLVGDMLQNQGAPPRIAVELGDPTSEAGLFRVPVRVTNNGDEAAEQVAVEVSLDDEASMLTIDLLPSQSEERGAVFFRADPHSGELQTRVIGYVVP